MSARHKIPKDQRRSLGETPFIVRQSSVKQWRRCRQAYHFKHVEGLEKKIVARPLKFGTLVHNMIEEYANGDDPFRVLRQAEKEQGKLFRKEIEEYGNIIDDLRVIMTEYFLYWKDKDLQYLRVNKRSAEHKFSTLIEPGLLFEGTIDAFGRTPNRLKWLVEHKTFKWEWKEDDRWRDVQSNVYKRAQELMGWPDVDGIAWDYVWSKVPQVPQLRKDGQMSKKGIVTLPTRVHDTIKAAGVPASKVKHLLDVANKNRSRYFHRIYTPIKPRLVDSVWSDFVDTAREMQEKHGKSCTKTIDKHCSWCPFEPLCRAQLLGGDVDFIKRTQYVKDDKTGSVDAEKFDA